MVGMRDLPETHVLIRHREDGTMELRWDVKTHKN
jgi:hypothetical protein